MSNILITGGSGLLAVNWAIQLRKEHKVTLGLHNRKIQILGVEAIFLNLEIIDEIRKVLDEFLIDIVIHTAALSNIELCESNPLLAKHVNVQLTSNIAFAAYLHGAKLVHISTDHLFDGSLSMRTENDETRTLNNYAKTKLQSEEVVTKECPEALIIRTNFYGWGTSYRRSFSDEIIYSLKNGKEIYLFEDVYYTPILINVLVDVVHNLIKKTATGIFNIVGDERLSKYDFGIKLAEEFCLNTKLICSTQLIKREDLVRRPLDMSLDNKKVKNILGIEIGEVGIHLKILRKNNDELNTLRRI